MSRQLGPDLELIRGLLSPVVAKIQSIDRNVLKRTNRYRQVFFDFTLRKYPDQDAELTQYAENAVSAFNAANMRFNAEFLKAVDGILKEDQEELRELKRLQTQWNDRIRTATEARPDRRAPPSLTAVENEFTAALDTFLETGTNTEENLVRKSMAFVRLLVFSRNMKLQEAIDKYNNGYLGILAVSMAGVRGDLARRLEGVGMALDSRKDTNPPENGNGNNPPPTPPRGQSRGLFSGVFGRSAPAPQNGTTNLPAPVIADPVPETTSQPETLFDLFDGFLNPAFEADEPRQLPQTQQNPPPQLVDEQPATTQLPQSSPRSRTNVPNDGFLSRTYNTITRAFGLENGSPQENDLEGSRVNIEETPKEEKMQLSDQLAKLEAEYADELKDEISSFLANRGQKRSDESDADYNARIAAVTEKMTAANKSRLDEAKKRRITKNMVESNATTAPEPSIDEEKAGPSSKTPPVVSTTDKISISYGSIVQITQGHSLSGGGFTPDESRRMISEKIKFEDIFVQSSNGDENKILKDLRKEFIKEYSAIVEAYASTRIIDVELQKRLLRTLFKFNLTVRKNNLNVAYLHNPSTKKAASLSKFFDDNSDASTKLSNFISVVIYNAQLIDPIKVKIDPESVKQRRLRNTIQVLRQQLLL